MVFILMLQIVWEVVNWINLAQVAVSGGLL